MSLPIPHPLVPEFIYQSVRSIGFSETGRDLAPVIFVVLTMASWPVALALRWIHSPIARLSLCSVTGAVVMVGVYGWETILVFIAFILAFYVPCRYRLMSPGLVSALALFSLGAIHYDSMLSGTATDRMSQTGTLMMIVAKICMFAFHMEDGRRQKQGIVLSSHAHIATQRSVTAVPEESVNLVKFLCYNLEFQGGLVGPLFSYSEFMDFIHVRGDFAAVHEAPFLVPAFKATTRAFATVGAYIFLSAQPWFGAQTLLAEWFLQSSFWWRLLVTPFLVAGCRLAYVAVWSLSEVACTLSGLAYQPPARFTRGRNVNFRQFELSTNFNQVTANWNIRISDLWLKQCVYQRVESVPAVLRPLIPNHKALANLTTKLTSAFWHGWYAGYGTSFLSLGLGNWTETVIRKRLHPILPPWLLSHPLATPIAWVHTWWSVNFFFAPFVLLTWERAITFYSSMHWCMHIYHLLIIGVLTLAPRGEINGKPVKSL